MKKILALVLVLVLSLSVFAACAKPIDWANTYLAPEDYANEDWTSKEIKYQFTTSAEASAGNGPTVVNLFKDGSIVAWQGSVLSKAVQGYSPEDVTLIYPEYKIFHQVVGYWTEAEGKLEINVFLYDDDEEYIVCTGEIDANGVGKINGFPTKSCVVKYQLDIEVNSDGTIPYKTMADFYDSFKSYWA